MSERLVVKFEKGTGGPIRTAIGDLVPTYVTMTPDELVGEITEVGKQLRTDRDGGHSENPPAWGLMLSDVQCDGEFAGRATWFHISFSHIITIRPFGGTS